MSFLKNLGFAAALTVAGVSGASATVVTFDDLTGGGSLADGYGGIIWGGQWNYYDDAQSPYTPASPLERIYTANNASVGSFSFASAVTFVGLAVSGFDFASVGYDLFLNNVQVGSTVSLTPSGVPAFLASGYSGLVDKVVVSTTANFGFFVVDDVTYDMAAVPLPGAGLLLLGGLGGLAALRRSRKV